MGNSMYNKIYLGRRSVFASRRWQAVLAIGLLTGIAFGLFAVRALRHGPSLQAEASGGYHVAPTSLDERGNGQQQPAQH
jgi:hypothetical protein